MQLKILHTGDIHLGAPFTILGERGREQRQQLVKTFETVIDLALKEKVHLFLICGDLFNSNNPSKFILEKVLNCFKKLEKANIPICIIPGTHDCYDTTSIYHHFNFQKNLSNLVIFTDKVSQKVFPNLNLTVYGRAVTAKTLNKSPLSDLRPRTKTKFHVGMAHGSLKIPKKVEKDGAIFTSGEIKKTKMHYLALGHWHSFSRYKFGSTVACYAGSPEFVSLDQRKSGNVCLVIINPKGTVKVKPNFVGRRRFEKISVSVDPIATLGEIIKSIKEKANPNLILEVVLKGLCSFDLNIDQQQLEQELESNFFRLKIVNQSHPKLEEISNHEFPENMVIGKFAGLMREKIKESEGEERELAEEALKLGITLLRNKEVL